MNHKTSWVKGLSNLTVYRRNKITFFDFIQNNFVTNKPHKRHHLKYVKKAIFAEVKVKG